MKIKDLPSPKSKVTIYLKSGKRLSGTIYSPYKMPPGEYNPEDSWRVAFLPEGEEESRMHSYSVRAIERCECKECGEAK